MDEQQAIGRALRLGQTKKVVVTRYIMKGTIEEVCNTIYTRSMVVN
jgi:SNF2 family DNA or RNA helicase